MKNNRLTIPLACEKEKGANLVEYALLVSLISIVCIMSLSFLGHKSSQNFNELAVSLKHSGGHIGDNGDTSAGSGNGGGSGGFFGND